MKPTVLGLQADQIEHRIVGALSGAALGDAFAFPFKGHSRAFLSTVSDVVKAGFNRHPSNFFPEGQVSDETQCMRATTQAILEQETVDAEVISEFLIPLFRDGHIVDPGAETLKALQGLIKGRTSFESSGLDSEHISSDPLSRVLPVALLHAGESQNLEEDIRKAISITHLDDLVLASAASIAGALSYVVTVPEIFLGDFLDATIEATRPFHSGFADVIEDFPRLLSMTEYRAFEQMAQALERLEISIGEDYWSKVPNNAPFQALISLYLFLRSPFKLGQLLTHAFHTGGEITSMCTLCGALGGGLKGLSALPEVLLDQLSESRDLKKEARGLFLLWKSRYKDLESSS